MTMGRVCTLSCSNQEHGLFLHLLSSCFDFFKLIFIAFFTWSHKVLAVQAFFLKISRWFLKLSWIWANGYLSNSACFMIMAFYSLPFPSDSCYRPTLCAHVFIMFYYKCGQILTCFLVWGLPPARKVDF